MMKKTSTTAPRRPFGLFLGKHLAMAVFLALLIAVMAAWTPSCGGGGDDDDDSGDDDTVDDDTVDDDTADDDTADDDTVDDDDTADDDTGDDDTISDYPLDETLRLNDIQALGTHNSYHVERDGISHPEHRYSHKPLNEQLDIGVRKFELDTHWSESKGFQVYHIYLVDMVSTCDTFTECISVLKTWSDAHPTHHPFLVLVETKGNDNNPIAEHLDELEDELLAVWPRDRLLTPDDVRGDRATLREAVLNDGWPALGDVRGKAIFHLHDGGTDRAAYLQMYPGLKGAAMFTDSGANDEWGAIRIMNDAIGQFDEIQDAVADGFLVRTRADSCCDEAIANDHTRAEKALASGAHFISTDFPELTDDYDYTFSIPGGTPSRCNPIHAPNECTAYDVEHGVSE
ncbi:MAG: hypothetical protein H6684_02745 [Deltaproteobacteria bacterium]|nr:hypothetical protein [Deltaproteobacteria bacterium]MCB9487632.1 hypothetical protein [Deltaproteobacteria bacterium]